MQMKDLSPNDLIEYSRVLCTTYEVNSLGTYDVNQLNISNIYDTVIFAYYHHKDLQSKFKYLYYALSNIDSDFLQANIADIIAGVTNTLT